MTRRLTTDEFVRKAKKVHGDEYDYSKSEYINGNTKICIICKKHGQFYQLAQNHLKGAKCRKCSYERTSLKRKYKLDDLIQKARKIHGNKYIYDEFYYFNIITPSIIICKKHGKFFQNFNDHIHKRTGCPKCAIENRKVKKSVISYDEVMKEWDYKKNTILPSKVSYGSHKKVWWKCKCGHSWLAMVRNRTINKTGCPKCKIGLSKENCISSTHPYLLKEWDFKKNSIFPEDVTYGSQRKVWWKCEKGHEWYESIKHRTKGYGCPYCSGRRVCKDNCFKTLCPELLKEWDDVLRPEDFTLGSSKKIWWKCKNGHRWKMSIYSRTSGRSCPYCSGNKVCDQNSLAHVKPELLLEWSDKNKEDPSQISYGSKKVVWWKCKNGHEWKSSINNRSSGFSCPYCSKRISRKAEKWLNSLKVEKREQYININGKKIYVDGFDPASNTIYEYFGNFWHGNPDIYDSTKINPITKTSFGFLYRKTIEKIQLIRNSKFNLIFKWEESSTRRK